MPIAAEAVVAAVLSCITTVVPALALAGTVYAALAIVTAPALTARRNARTVNTAFGCVASNAHAAITLLTVATAAALAVRAALAVWAALVTTLGHAFAIDTTHVRAATVHAAACPVCTGGACVVFTTTRLFAAPVVSAWINTSAVYTAEAENRARFALSVIALLAVPAGATFAIAAALTIRTTYIPTFAYALAFVTT